MSGRLVVERIRTGGGSHIEPPCDESWDNFTKLRWHAAVVECDTGLRVSVVAGGAQRKRFGRWVDVPGQYSMQVGGSAIGSFDFYSGWDFLSGVSIGAREAQATALGNAS